MYFLEVAVFKEKTARVSTPINIKGWRSPSYEVPYLDMAWKTVFACEERFPLELRARNMKGFTRITERDCDVIWKRENKSWSGHWEDEPPEQETKP